MEPKEIIRLINLFPFFEGFSNVEKEIIASQKNNILKISDKEVIVRQLDVDYSVYFLLQGKANVNKIESPNIIINDINAGSIIGEMAFLAKTPRSTNVIANGDVLVLKLDEEFLTSLDTDVQLKFLNRFIQVLIRRILTSNDAVLKLKNELSKLYEEKTEINNNSEDLKQKRKDIQKNFSSNLNLGNSLEEKLPEMIDEIENILNQ